MADIVLINPRFEPSYWGMNYALPLLDGKAVLPVMGLPLLAALTPAEHKITIIDENVENIDFDRCSKADIVGVTGMNVQRARMQEILVELKQRNLFTIVGGPWITVEPDDFAGLRDVVFMGEAEQTWPVFLTEWTEGRHQRRYEQSDKTDMTKVPAPRLDLLKMNRYLSGSLQISRGCPFTCEFCDIIVIFGRRPRLKTAAQVIAELDNLLRAGKREVFIVDDNLIGNKKAIKPILREIIAWQRARGYPLNLVTEASIDLAEDPELVELMVEARFESVFIGIESPNEDALKETKKIQNLSDRSGTVLEKVHRIQHAGIDVWCGMIVGFDNDDERVFESQRKFIEDARIVHAMVNILNALPSTPLFARLAKEGRLDNSGDASNFGVITTNFMPKNMSRRALFDGYLGLMKDLYSPESYFARLDALYLDAGYLPSPGSRRYLRDHPWWQFQARWRAGWETLFVFIQLMRLVPQKELRREYRRRIWNVIRRSPHIRLLRAYVVKCTMHFHYHQLIQKFSEDRVKLRTETDRRPSARPDVAQFGVPLRSADPPQNQTALRPPAPVEAL